MIRVPEHLPVTGNGTHRYLLCYKSYKRRAVPVYDDSGMLPAFGSPAQAEAAAARHKLPWSVLIVLGFHLGAWTSFAGQQGTTIGGVWRPAWEEYHDGMAFDVARDEAAEGRERKIHGARVVSL